MIYLAAACAVILFIMIFYSVIPTLVIRKLEMGIKKSLPGSKGIALTFDDGPHPEYTVKLLDLLKKYKVKASFFVVGSKAQRYPNIIKRMHAEGHTVGIHHFNHISGWLLPPISLKMQLDMTEKAIERITKSQVRFYRPPWGHFNLFTLVLSRKYSTVMWSGIFGDWKVKNHKTLLQEMRKATKDGAIFLLHDCGETFGADREAPGYMLESLEVYLEEQIVAGVHFVTLKDAIPTQERIL
ncbi:polysaccharide deacetylase family protein [Peribacillus kribbensis]|uniref:polysaccharide deacetylase family protein n=1 Tax=Peribacillus kribbensis TaxID=356658 RepID=UPI00040F7F6E|nr:polysaccharide deacetylase family protein [Peribacillus kribbensis]